MRREKTPTQKNISRGLKITKSPFHRTRDVYRKRKKSEVKLPIADKIKGALTFSINTYKDKIFYIFGDTHKYSDCGDGYTNITDYIMDIMFQQQVPVDLFVETHIGTNPKDDQGELKDLGFLIKDCITGDRSNCPFGENRVHYLDIRETDLKDISRHRDILDLCIDILEKHFEVEEVSVSQTKIMLEKLMELDISENTFRVLTKEVNKSKFKDKIKRFDKLNLWDTSYSYRADDYLREVKGLKYLYDILLNKENVSELGFAMAEDLLFYFKNMKEMLFDIMLIYTDKYAIARFMKDYVKNVVIFAGDTHSNHYREFISFIGGKELYFTRSKPLDNLCIDMKDVPQPFFGLD
jgi:hypothetical protein